MEKIIKLPDELKEDELKEDEFKNEGELKEDEFKNEGEFKEDELKNELKKLQKDIEEIIEEKKQKQYEPGTIHILGTYFSIIKKNIEKIKEALAEFKLSKDTNTIEQNQ